MGSRIYRFQSFGVPFDVVVGGSRRLFPESSVRAALPPMTRVRRTRKPTRSYSFCERDGERALVVDDGPPVACPSLRSAQDAFEGDLALHVAASAPRHIFIHAGVVGWLGRALILPGRTFTGKSSLVHALVECGATYYSDEYALIDAEGRIRPYPRRMSLRRDGKLPRRVLPERLGTRALAAGWVVASRFDPGKATLSFEPLSRGRSALLLLDNAVAARLEPKRVLKAVRMVSESAEGGSVVRGEARVAANELLLLLTAQGTFNRR